MILRHYGIGQWISFQMSFRQPVKLLPAHRPFILEPAAHPLHVGGCMTMPVSQKAIRCQMLPEPVSFQYQVCAANHNCWQAQCILLQAGPRGISMFQAAANDLLLLCVETSAQHHIANGHGRGHPQNTDT